MTVFFSILIVLVILGILCTIHELGHFFMARMLGIKVFEVSIFIGPTLLSWRKNGVDYTIRALPFGAYVRFTEINEEGEAVDSDDPELLINQKRWKRLIVSLAGPFMNLLLGILVLAALFFFSGYYTTDIVAVPPGTQLEVAVADSEEFELGDTVLAVNGHAVNTSYDYYADESYLLGPKDTMILTMRSQSSGEEYELTLVPEELDVTRIGITYDATKTEENDGWLISTVEEYQNNNNPVILPGDILKSIDGISVTSEEISEVLSSLKPDQVITLKYIRDGQEQEASCSMTRLKTLTDRGIFFVPSVGLKLSRVPAAFFEAVKMPVSLINLTVRGFESIFAGREEIYNMVSGPVGITYAVSTVVEDESINTKVKFLDMINFLGIISILLVFSNLLPIPGLDGIQIILIIVEMILGRRISKKAESILTVVGFFMMLILISVALIFDIMRISNGG